MTRVGFRCVRAQCRLVLKQPDLLSLAMVCRRFVEYVLGVMFLGVESGEAVEC